MKMPLLFELTVTHIQMEIAHFMNCRPTIVRVSFNDSPYQFKPDRKKICVSHPNHRPPSVYGKSIPINDRLYNADLNLDLTSGLVVEFVASKWDTIKQNAKNWFRNEDTGNWKRNCHEDITLNGKTEACFQKNYLSDRSHAPRL